MPQLEQSNEITKVYCCCFKRTLYKVPSNCRVSFSQIQDEMKIAYCGEVPKDLKTGDAICITGCINPKCMRFAVNLLCTSNANSDIAFHFNPRLDRHYIVRNARISDRWGVEEAASTVKCELNRSEKFEILFLIIDDEFMVSINGKHFCIFKFRVPLNLITNLEITGDVDIFNVEYKKFTIYPEIKTDKHPLVIEVENEQEQPEELLTIPCTAHLPQGFQEGWQLEIYGRVKLLPHSFYINLQEGAQLWPHPNIPLHFNPRFKSVAGEDVIVRNAWIDGRWGPEERPPGFPLSPGSPFCIGIRKDTDYFAVWIDGQLTAEFKYRSSINKIDTVYIQGDIVLQKLVMHDKFVPLHTPIRESIQL